MAGIAAIDRPGREGDVGRLLDALGHRGGAGRAVQDFGGTTLGVTWPSCQCEAGLLFLREGVAHDALGAARNAEVRPLGGTLAFNRDPLGVAPLYYGRAADGALVCASEVKALLLLTTDVHELPPGHRYDGSRLVCWATPGPATLLDDPPGAITTELRRRLAAAVERAVDRPDVGSWLSGGIDSSLLAALAAPRVRRLHTFSVGLPEAPDLVFARQVAEHLGAFHHELVVTPAQLIDAVPVVVRALESFDALLVRSSLVNFLVGKLAAGHVPAVLSGEAGDELFAGYAYLKGLRPEDLPRELESLLSRLHDTALQRVDRCSAAHGLVAHVPFADPEVVEYARRIPAALKLRDGVEKWILRQAAEGLLPESVVRRPKSKFWEGSGVGELLAGHAAAVVTDADFARERTLPDGSTLASKEELLYWRTFREHFGAASNLGWFGRTVGAPRQEP